MVKVVSPSNFKEEIIGTPIFMVFPIWGAPEHYFDKAIELLDHASDDYSVPITVITNRTPEISVAHSESVVEKHHKKNFQWLVEQHDFVLQKGVTFVGLPKPVKEVSEYAKYAGLVLSNSLQSHRMYGSHVVLFREKGVVLHDEHKAQLRHEQNQVKVFPTLEASIKKVVQIALGLRRLKEPLALKANDSMLD